jgi:hypothetical protein
MFVSNDCAPSEGSSGSACLDVLVTRSATIWPFLMIGVTCTTAGGLVAAVTRPTQFTHGSWLAAYLVLVGGVAQIGLGTGQALLADHCPTPSRIRLELLAWNVGLVAVIVGTMVPAVLVTTLGGVLTAAALATFIAAGLHARRPLRLGWCLYMGTACFVLLSTPIGLALSWRRHS